MVIAGPVLVLIGLSTVMTVQAFGGCGRRPGGTRIISGQDALPNSWPWMVQIGNERGHHCGGALVHPEWVVTAAHCVYWEQSPSHLPKYKLVLGEHQRSVKDGTEQVIGVRQIIAHPKFDSQTVDNDIALIRLKRPALLNNEVGLVCLPRQNYWIREHSQCFATGWGLTVPEDWTSQADILQQIRHPLVSQSKCKKNYRNTGAAITNNMVCGGFGGNTPENTCNTDSGGPVVCMDSSGRWILQGVVSFGVVGCHPGYYSGNVRVGRYTSWINSHINA